MSILDILLISILIIPLIFIFMAWAFLFRSFIRDAANYVGDKYVEKKYVLKPNDRINVKLNGKCVIIVQGSYGWVILSRASKIKQRIYRIKLLEALNEDVEIINSSRTFSVIVLIRCQDSISSPNNY